MDEKFNNEEILGIFNGFQGQIEALKFTFTGKCLKIIFTTKRLIVAEENVGLIKRISWSHDYNCVTADETKKANMRQNTIYDFIDKTKILNQISLGAVKKIEHKPSADVYLFIIHMDKSDEKIKYQIPIRGDKEKNKKIFKEFFGIICTKAAKETFSLIEAISKEEGPGIIKSILESRVDVDFALKNGVTPLILAVGKNYNSEVIEMLIDGGANVNAQTKEGLTVLMAASSSTSNPEIIEKLISSGADVNSRGEGGITALMEAAASNKNPEIIKTLIKAGADINEVDENGFTALMIAAYKNEPEIVEIFLDEGADPTKECKAGDTAFEYAKQNEKLVDTPIFQKLKVTG